MIIFNIPSLVPLVPGGPAYQAIRELVLGDSAKSLDNLKIVIMTAGAIAAGFMITSLVETLVFKFNPSIKKDETKVSLLLSHLFITAIPADVGHFITNKWRLNRGFYHNFILANN